MKKLSIILLLSCIFAASLKAQPFLRHEFAVNVSTGDASYESFLPDVESRTSLETDELSEPFFPSLGFEYLYNLNRRWSIGLALGFGKRWEELGKFSDSQGWTDLVDSQGRAFYIMPEVRIRWYQTKNGLFSVYSKGAVGYARVHSWIESENIGYDETRHTAAFQVTFGGIEFGSKRWPHLYSELGYGHQGFFMIGMKMGF